MTSTSRDTYYLIDITEEPILELLDNKNMVSINCYGARCLNSMNLWFADIDFEDYITNLISYSKQRTWLDQSERRNWDVEEEIDFSKYRDFMMFNDRAHPYRAKVRRELVKLASIDLVEPSNGGYRLYETHSGLRLIRTDKEMEPRSRESVREHMNVSTDRRFSELCIYQNCYRARLSPKPWRVNDGQEARVARLIDSFTVEEGKRTEDSATIDPSLEKIIEYHDVSVGALSANRKLIA